MSSTALGFSTRAIHGGQFPDPATGAILTPIVQSTTYVQEAVGRHKGFTYSRSGNPTVAALERNLGELEGVGPAVCFGSGMSAETALCLTLLKAGDHVVASDVIYGGTVRLLDRLFAPFGVTTSYVDGSSVADLRAAITDRTRVVFVESPGNPTLRLCSLQAAAEAAHENGALLAVDNTLMTPALQRPFEFGADVVVYSTTKFLEGHNATIGGALLATDAGIAERFRFVQNAAGLIQSPFDAWLTLRGIKTLDIRMARHSANALQVARFLAAHPRVTHVSYPWLEDFPRFDLARRQQRAGGGLIAFEVAGGVEAGVRVMNAVRLCSLAENLGAVESLVTHPASMTHADVPAEQRARAGITDGLIRLSVGLENPEDVIADLSQALEVCR